MKMARVEAQEFRKRWQRVNEAEIEELRRMSPAEKLRQVAALMESASAFGWDKAQAAEDQQVRERWLRLRKACHAV